MPRAITTWIGLDISSTNIGWVVLEENPRPPNLLDAKWYGRQQPDGALSSRCSEAHTLAQWLINNMAEPVAAHTGIAIEKPVFYTGGKAAAKGDALIKVASVFGAVIGALSRYKHPSTPIILVPPTSAKKTLTGNGRASKKQMIDRAAVTLFGGAKQNEHTSDAAAVAYTAWVLYRDYDPELAGNNLIS